MINRNPTAPHDEGTGDNLPVAIPLGDAIDPGCPVVVYECSPHPYAGLPTVVATAILDTVPISSRTGTSPAATSTKMSSFAIVSLILGITSIVFAVVGGILAIVFGTLAIHRIRQQPDEYRGLCMAYSGIITGTIATVFWLAVFFS